MHADQAGFASPTAADALADLPADLRRLSLTHSSLAAHRTESYERLEFLGDSILGAAVSQMLYREQPDWEEGQLSKLKAELVSRRVCRLVADEVGLDAAFAAMVQEAGSDRTPELSASPNVLSALVESVIGATFLAHGFERAATLVEAWFGPHIKPEVETPRDAKSELQEWAQERGETVSYELLGSEGPDHDRTFEAEARVSGVDQRATGSGSSRKAAERAAALALIESLHVRD